MDGEGRTLAPDERRWALLTGHARQVETAESLPLLTSELAGTTYSTKPTSCSGLISSSYLI
jgi:hypothetical protein